MTAEAAPTPAPTSVLPRVERALGRSAAAWLAVLTIGVMGVLAGLLISPGRSFVGIYVNDLMVFYDGAHRILSGQIPNRDFHTPLGPLAYLLPAFGMWAGKSLGEMIPIASAVYAAMLAGPLFYVSATRLPFVPAAVFVLYIAVLTIVPVNPGDSGLDPTYAMFYNRFGWAGLSVLLAFALPQIRTVAPAPARNVLDAACIAWLLLVLFYLKLSYAAVGLAFTVALLVLPTTRRFAALALIGMVAGMVAVEAVWRATGAYFADALNAASVSGAVRGGAFQMASLIISNLRQESVYTAALVLGVARKTRPVYLLASVVMAVCGVFLLNQNAQNSEIPVLIPAALLAALGPTAAASAAQPFRLTTLLLVGALAAPAIGTGVFGLRHFRHELKHAPSDPASVAELDGVVTHEGPFVPSDPGRPAPHVAPGTLERALQTGVTDSTTMNLLRQIPSRQPLAQSEYLASLADGARLLRADPRLAGPVYTYDLQNPFNAMLGRRPPRGDNSWNHYGRTFNERVFLPPENSLADVQIIMDPKDPMELDSEVYQKSNYASYVERHFRLAAETSYWRVYQRLPEGR